MFQDIIIITSGSILSKMIQIKYIVGYLGCHYMGVRFQDSGGKFFNQWGKFFNPCGNIFSSHRRALQSALSQRAVAAGAAAGAEGKFTFFAITWIRFIGFRQNLAWTYYLTLGTSLRRNFSFFSKSKMTTGGQKSKIGQILPHKSHFGSSFESGSSDLDKIWHGHTT